MKKLLSAASAVIITLLTFTLNASAISFNPSFEIKSEAVYLMNLDSKDVIFEKNADKEEMPAALTNIMTAIVVLDKCKNIEDETIAANDDLYTEFDNYEFDDDLRYADIWDGDTFTVKDYLYAMMLTSSCEAAVILADHFGGNSVEKFVDMMNDKAKQLGCKNTVFKNPHGLYDPDQHTTAYDMALMTQYALTVPGFEDIACAMEYQLEPKNPGNAHDGGWNISHSNVMMSAANDYYLFGIKGIKTGNLQLGGRNIVTMGTNDGIKYLLVMLNSPLVNEDGDMRYYHIMDAYNMMKWVFENFSYATLLDKNEEVAELKVSNSNGNGYVLLKPAKSISTLWYNDVDTTSVQTIKTLAEDVSAPVNKGQKLGEMELRLGDELIDVVDLVAADNVERSFLKFNFSMTTDFFTSRWFLISVIITSILSFIYILICFWAYQDRKRRSKSNFANKKIVKKLYRNNRRR